MGRDVIAFRHDGGWVNYQCKHYVRPLRPSDIWVELGKVMYYTHRGDFSAPAGYLFVAPQGAGTSLARKLDAPAELRQDLMANWDSHCRTTITKAATVELDDAMRQHIVDFDFAIFGYVPPLTIIDGHRRTPYFVARFGGGLPARPEVEEPPEEIGDKETVYVRALLDAYAQHSAQPIASVDALKIGSTLGALREHFGDARREFYSAEALRSFSRDSLPPREFERLQQHVRDGVIDVARAAHDDAYRRVLAVVAMAKLISLDAHALNSCVGPLDRGGICHQLVNDGRLRWSP
jgi:hypothetical protein